MRVPIQAQCALSCNDGLQVSLDASGHALITTQMMAPNAGSSCPGPLTLSLFSETGQPLSNPLGCAQIGQTVTARVRHNTSGNFCTGTLELTDALSPVLSNCGEKFIFCHEDPAPEVLGLPAGTDNCTSAANIDYLYFDEETSFACGTFQAGQQVLKRIDRHWTASDEHGNTSTCLQTIWLKHVSAFSANFPPNRDGISSPALSCGQDPGDLSLTGQPTVNGSPIGASPECEVAAAFTDQTINHCAPAGFTVLRTWTVVDFCSGALNTRVQIIKVEDKEAPSLSAPDDLTIGTDGFTCTGSLSLPQAVFSDNCSSVTVTPSWTYGSGYGPFTGISEGPHLVTYTATDACGNSTTATMVVTVEDTSPPQAICESDLQISLSSNGVGYVNFNSIDAGSSDNCGPVFLSISRDGIEYLPQIQVTCTDQGMPIMITLKVTDAVGLENFCEMEITVRDFLKPAVQCPPNLTLNCLQDYNNLSLTGQATASDNCALKSLTHQDIVNIQPCNIGSVTRWWIATDSAANTRSCSQKITVNVVNGTSVTFPANISVTACGSPASLLPAATGSPVLSGPSCSPLSVNYTDQVFSIAPPSCFRIFRAWKVVDHCVYNPNGGSAGIWEQTQLIDVVDHTPPALNLPPDVTVEADAFTCLGAVQVDDASATDCNTQVTIVHNSAYSGAGQSTNASGQYPPGLHLITFTASDACGNAVEQTLKITVLDATAPSAVCLPGVSVQMPASGVLTLDPQIFDGGCSDFCSPQNSLVFSVSPSEITCQQTGLQPVSLTVQDTAGNTASCVTQVLVQDNAGVCGGGGGLHRQVEGHIRTETGLPVNNIEVSIYSDGFIEFTHCDTTGYYGFSDVPEGFTYNVLPYNNANWVNGMTTYDLVLISKHIIGTDPLNSPYKMLAADANRSGSITTFDIVQFRKVILGILDSLPNNSSWRFVDSSFVFPNPQNPFQSAIPEEIIFDPLLSDQSGQNFVGLKVGDVNGSTNPAIARAPQDTLWLEIPDRAFEAGAQLEIPLELERWTGLEGLQFELAFDPEIIDIVSIDYAVPDVLGQVNTALKAQGLLAVSWDNAVSKVATSNNKVLILKLSTKQNGRLRSSIMLKSSGIAPEAYRPDQEERAALGLHFSSESAKTPIGLPEIFPNPNAGTFTVINPFDPQPVSLSISDLNGKIVWEEQGVLPTELEIRVKDLFPAGVYTLSLKSAGQVLMGKLVITK